MVVRSIEGGHTSSLYGVHVLGSGSREASADMTEVGDVIYVCIFISRSVGFHLHVFFVLFVHMYLPTYLTFACVRFDTENNFSLPFVLYLFLFRTRFSQEGFRFSLQDENLPYL